ncbi:unnamed protein product [Orchesella dallaii]|uniref:C2H2-type domain-containing protein n=1 Tax=Orchesella dallaii TaxID=48710 RepID=A0ABP1RGM4_9HEXA
MEEENVHVPIQFKSEPPDEDEDDHESYHNEIANDTHDEAVTNRKDGDGGISSGCVSEFDEDTLAELIEAVQSNSNEASVVRGKKVTGPGIIKQEKINSGLDDHEEDNGLVGGDQVAAPGGVNGGAKENDRTFDSIPVTRRSSRKRKNSSKFLDVEEPEPNGEVQDEENNENSRSTRTRNAAGRKRMRNGAQIRPSRPEATVIACPKSMKAKPGRKRKVVNEVKKNHPDPQRYHHHHDHLLISDLEKKADKYLVVPLNRCDKEIKEPMSLRSLKTRIFEPEKVPSPSPPPPPPDRFACQDCQKPFPTLEAVSNHLLQTSDDLSSIFGDEIPCSACESTFQRLSCLEYHLSSHFQVKCRFCDEIFRKDKDLFEHFTSNHLKKPSSADADETNLDNHQESDHDVFEDSGALPDHFDDDYGDDNVVDDIQMEYNDNEKEDPSYGDEPRRTRGRGRPPKHPKAIEEISSLKKLKKKKKKHSRKMRKELKKKMKTKAELKQVEKQESIPAGDEQSAAAPAEPPRPRKKAGRPPRIYTPEQLWEKKTKEENRRKAMLKRMKDQVKKAKSNRKQNAKKRKASQDKKQREEKSEEKRKGVPLSLQEFLRAHRIHRVILSSELISREISVSEEILKRTSPSVGSGTFENPHWTLLSNSELHCICPACGRTFLSLEELHNHHQQAHNLICATCTICGKPQVKKSRLARHMKGHCNAEELKIRYEQEVQEHGEPLPKQEDRLYKCSECAKILIGWLPLTVHEKYWHDIEAEPEVEEVKPKDNLPKSYICELCGKSVKTKHNLKKHKKKHKRAMRRAANGEPERRKRIRYNDPAMCPTCGKVFKSNCSLKAHERYTHTEPAMSSEPTKCPICARPFVSKRFMHTHVPTHLNKREKEMFNEWSSTMDEFIEFLNSGEDGELKLGEDEEGQEEVDVRSGYQDQRQFPGNIGGAGSSSNMDGHALTAGMNFLNAYAASSSYLSVFAPR